MPNCNAGPARCCPRICRARSIQGMVTEDRARELARLRQQNQHIDQRSRAQQQQFEAERQQQQITQLQSATAAAVNARPRWK